MTLSPFPATLDLVDSAVLTAVIDSYPGPALHLSAANEVQEANAAAEEMLDFDPHWL